MMMNRVRIVALTVLVAQTAFFLFVGIGAGIRQKWMGMIILFFMAVLFVVLCTNALMTLKIKSCFSRLEELIFEKSDFVRSITKASNRKGICKVNNLIEKIVSILSLISTPVFLSLGLIAYLRRNAFWMGVLLLVCIVNHIILREFLIALKIDSFSKRFEQLISADKDGTASEKQSGE